MKKYKTKAFNNKVKSFLERISKEDNEQLLEFEFEVVKIIDSVLIVYKQSTEGKYDSSHYCVNKSRINVPIADLNLKEPNVCLYEFKHLKQENFTKDSK